MRSPFSLTMLLILLVVLGGLAILVHIGILTLAFQKLGLSPAAGFSVLIAALFGSGINIPLFRIKSSLSSIPRANWSAYQLLHPLLQSFHGWTLVAVNVGGCVIPVALVIILILSQPLDPGRLIIAITVVTAVSYAFSRSIPGMGISMPILIAPITAALTAGLIYPEQRGAAAYICGTLGVLIGADLLRLKDIHKLGTPLASIGGAGTFDGIFLTGIIAVLLA